MTSFLLMAAALVGGMWIITLLPLAECDQKAMTTGLVVFMVMSWTRLEAYLVQRRREQATRAQ